MSKRDQKKYYCQNKGKEMIRRTVFSVKSIQMLKTLMLFSPKTLQYRRKRGRSVAVLMSRSRHITTRLRYLND
jgi:hypothetical protein